MHVVELDKKGGSLITITMVPAGLYTTGPTEISVIQIARRLRTLNWRISAVRALIGRWLIFDADTIAGGFNTGQVIAPFYLRDAHAAQAVGIILLRAGALEFFHANANGCSGLQIKVGLKTHAAGTAIQYHCVITVCLIKI